MARSKKNSHRIVVHGVEYRWRASGNDGYIPVTIWPTNHIGPQITCLFDYHETSSRGFARDQIIVTNRLVRRVIEHVIENRDYDPHTVGNELTIRDVENHIDWSDAVRASDNQ